MFTTQDVKMGLKFYQEKLKPNIYIPNRCQMVVLCARVSILCAIHTNAYIFRDPKLQIYEE